MAFKHPHKLELKRAQSQEGKKFSEEPFVRDRRGRKIYRWAAFYSDCYDPFEQRKRDPWSIAERLEKQRKQEQYAESRIAQKEKARLARLDRIEEPQNTM